MVLFDDNLDNFRGNRTRSDRSNRRWDKNSLERQGNNKNSYKNNSDIFGTAGYKCVSRGIGGVKSRGWLVYQRNSDEINSLKRLLKEQMGTVEQLFPKYIRTYAQVYVLKHLFHCTHLFPRCIKGFLSHKGTITFGLPSEFLRSSFGVLSHKGTISLCSSFGRDREKTVWILVEI